MESPLFIEKPSRGLKNSLKKKGSENESYVARYLERQGWTLLGQNQKVEGIELDLIVQKQNAYLLIEVKSLYCEEYLEKILKKKQQKRLIRGARILEAYFKGYWQIYLATVDRRKRIQFFKIEG